MRRVGRVVAMGGAVDVPGNVTPDAEFNMHVDPEAAARVLAAGVALELVPLDATRQTVLAPAELEAALSGASDALAGRVRRFTAHAFAVDTRRRGRGMTLHDPLAVGLAADPSLATWEEARLAIGADGQTRRVAGAPNVRIARRVDAPRFLREFQVSLCRASS
jgi:purine nucleosidase